MKASKGAARLQVLWMCFFWQSIEVTNLGNMATTIMNHHDGCIIIIWGRCRLGISYSCSPSISYHDYIPRSTCQVFLIISHYIQHFFLMKPPIFHGSPPQLRQQFRKTGPAATERCRPKRTRCPPPSWWVRLVGGIPTPLKNMNQLSMGMTIPNSENHPEWAMPAARLLNLSTSVYPRFFQCFPVFPRFYSSPESALKLSQSQTN